MCKPASEGGRRCASHTRPRFHSAINAFNTAPSRLAQFAIMDTRLDDVAAHASTPTGGDEVAAMHSSVSASGDSSLAVFLAVGKRAGQQMADKCKEMEAEIAQRAAQAHSTPDPSSSPSGVPVTGFDAGSSGSDLAPVEPEWNPGTPNDNVPEHWSIAEGGDRWHAGGCGAFAIAMTERWPNLKIACEMYNDGGGESVAHAWAYDPQTDTRFHIFGAEPWSPTETPDYDPSSQRVLLDQSPEQVRSLFHDRSSCSEDNVMDAMDVAVEMFDPDFVADDEYDRSHLYF